MSMKNSLDTNGNRTRNFPACSAVPHPTAPPRAPAFLLSSFKLRKFEIKYCLYMLTQVQFSDVKGGTRYWVVRGSECTKRTAVIVTPWTFLLARSPFESWTEHQLSWSLLSSFIIRNVACRRLGQGICSICLSLEGGTDSLFRNVGRQLPTYAP